MLLIQPSRLRVNPLIRSLVRETSLAKEDLVMPLFFKEGKGREAIASMPGIAKLSESALLKELDVLQKKGVRTVLLFGSSSRKDTQGSHAYDEKSPFHKAIRAIKRASDVVLITDVCLCSYTSHGHCGIIKPQAANYKLQATKKSLKPAACSLQQKMVIDNEATLKALAKIAVSHAAAGADWVAPSAMADGQVKAIRQALDENGLSQTAILSYAVKYASSFYGPFRDIYDSSPAFGDRRSYQMDPGNCREALREAQLDIAEGADIIMVKPALSYLDIINIVRNATTVPVAAYNVSGEYSMVKAACEKGWLNEELAAMEILRSIKRAGADIIITYWAKEAMQWISRQG